VAFALREETTMLDQGRLPARGRDVTGRRNFGRLGVAGTLTTPFDPMTLTDQIAAILAEGR